MATIDRRWGRRSGWRYRVRVRGKSRQLSATFASNSEARRWAITQEARLYAQVQLPEAARHTLSELLSRYERDVLCRKKDSTARVYAVPLAWWREQLGHLPLSDVTPARLAACRDCLLQDRAPATVGRYLATLSHVFTMAQKEWEWVETSPLRKVRKPIPARGRVRCLSEPERERLLAACRRSANPYLTLVVMLALSTAARKAEVMGLSWSDVDLTRQTITLRHTKNGDIRSVPITGKAIDLIRSHAKVRRIDTPLVFPRADGKAPADIRYAWAQALRESKITDFRFHDLRHTAASYLAMSGASMVELSEILGHKSLSMVKRYAHLSPDHNRAVLSRMTSAIP